jgi:hypothetical protein
VRTTGPIEIKKQKHCPPRENWRNKDGVFLIFKNVSFFSMKKRSLKKKWKDSGYKIENGGEKT